MQFGLITEPVCFMGCRSVFHGLWVREQQTKNGKLLQALFSSIILNSCQDKHAHKHKSWANLPWMYLCALLGSPE